MKDNHPSALVTEADYRTVKYRYEPPASSTKKNPAGREFHKYLNTTVEGASAVTASLKQSMVESGYNIRVARGKDENTNRLHVAVSWVEDTSSEGRRIVSDGEIIKRKDLVFVSVEAKPVDALSDGFLAQLLMLLPENKNYTPVQEEEIPF